MAYTTINKPSLQFNTALYTGNGSTLTVTGVGFQPDFTWLKERSAAGNHKLADVIRGTTKYLSSNLTDAEDTTGSGIQSWNSDGFSLSNATDINDNGTTYASWNWKANGAGVANTAGTISSTVSANTTSGFSIVTYTGNGTSGATVGHGLGVTPACYIVKCRNAGGSNWSMYHQSLGNTKAMVFTATAERTSAVYWNNTSPTTTVFSLGNDHDVNVNTQTYVAYCFSEIKGYSKFGSYKGNSSTDGTFVYTGFKPAYLMIKQSSASGEGWFILDNKRETINPMGTLLIANDAGADNTSQNPILDFTSNGFKLRRTWSGVNGSGSTYIYMAFAEQPLVGTNNVPATAR